jgi:hypothetical protein
LNFVKHFQKEWLLDSYVEKARWEASEGGSEKICAGVDHLGAIFEEYMLAGHKNRLGQMLTPMNIVKMMTIMTLDYDIKHNETITIMDPATGTGRFLIMPTLMYPYKPLILYGIEIDLTLYRCALINMALYSSHPYYIICGDALRLNMDSTSFVWSLIANQWDPPDVSPYYWGYGRETTRALSFEELMKRKQERLQAERELHIEPEPQILQPIKVQQPRFSLENYVKSKNKK